MAVPASNLNEVNEGLPVTPLVTTPPNTQYQNLLCGIDSLDLGLYVSWGSDWKRRLASLDKMKQQARKKGGLLIQLPSGRSCIFKPGGKGENYRFHLQFAEYNLFIGKRIGLKLSMSVTLNLPHNSVSITKAWRFKRSTPSSGS